MAPYNHLSKNFHEWNNESLTWAEYCKELSLRESVMSNLTDVCNTRSLINSDDFLNDLFANLLFDNYCWKNLKSAKNLKDYFFSETRTSIWHFPLNISIKCIQKREFTQHRTDNIVHKKEDLFSYKKINKNMIISHDVIKSIIKNDSKELDIHLKNNNNKQILYEIILSIFGLEVQKNPASIMYNMMMIDLIKGIIKFHISLILKYIYKVLNILAKEATQVEFFDNRNNNALLPYCFDDSALASRYLNYYYSYIFDHWYSYELTAENEEKIFENVMNPNSAYNIERKPKIEEKIEEMLKCEYNLVYKWIAYKAKNDQKAASLRTIKDLWEYLIGSTNKWFQPFNLNPLRE